MKNINYDKDIINYLFTFSLLDGRKYEKKIKNNNINNLEDEIDLFFEKFKFSDLTLFLLYIYSILKKTDIHDKGYTYFKIVEYLFEIGDYKTEDLINIIKNEKDNFLYFNDGIYSYVMILFSFGWIEKNYLKGNIIFYDFLLSELNNFRKDINLINQLKNMKDNYYKMLKDRFI